MSIVCAVKKADHIAIAADTQSNYGSVIVTADYLTNCKKIYGVKDSFVGVVGWHAITTVFEHVVAHHSELLDFSNRLSIFDSLLKLHPLLKSDYFVETKEDDDEQPVESNQIDAIIVNKNGLFEISSYKEVNEYERFWAIGSGRKVALGAMHALYETEASADTIARAGAKAAAAFDDSCGLPIHCEMVEIS